MVSLLFKGASTTKWFSHSQEPSPASTYIHTRMSPAPLWEGTRPRELCKGLPTLASEVSAEGGGGSGTLLQVPSIREDVCENAKLSMQCT